MFKSKPLYSERSSPSFFKFCSAGLTKCHVAEVNIHKGIIEKTNTLMTFDIHVNAITYFDLTYKAAQPSLH